MGGVWWERVPADLNLDLSMLLFVRTVKSQKLITHVVQPSAGISSQANLSSPPARMMGNAIMTPMMMATDTRGITRVVEIMLYILSFS